MNALYAVEGDECCRASSVERRLSREVDGAKPTDKGGVQGVVADLGRIDESD